MGVQLEWMAGALDSHRTNCESSDFKTNTFGPQATSFDAVMLSSALDSWGRPNRPAEREGQVCMEPAGHKQPQRSRGAPLPPRQALCYGQVSSTMLLTTQGRGQHQTPVQRPEGPVSGEGQLLKRQQELWGPWWPWGPTQRVSTSSSHSTSQEHGPRCLGCWDFFPETCFLNMKFPKPLAHNFYFF